MAPLLVAFAVMDANAQRNVVGEWQLVDSAQWDHMSGSTLVSGGGTHMALLRGNADSSWVLHWHHSSQARLWLTTTGNDVGVGVAVANTLGPDMFCSGHSTLADGKLLVLGGTVAGIVGEKRCQTFDARTYYNMGFGQTGGWRMVDSTSQGRWYGTSTTLADGRVLASAGSRWSNMVLFGGVRDQSGQPQLVNDMRPMNMGQYEKWVADGTTATHRPAVRRGHSAVYRGGFVYVYGGQDASGAPIGSPNDLKAVWGNDYDQGRQWDWVPLTISGTPPPARTRHTAVVHGNTMLVFGGLGANGVVLNDLWRLTFTDGTHATWDQLTLSGAPPARYGHTAVVARTEDENDPPVMLVYGGRTSESAFADDHVWELTIPLSGSQYSWRELAPSNNPGPREGHTAVVPSAGGSHHVQVPVLGGGPPVTHRMIVFGGLRDAPHPQADYLANDVWELRQQDPADWSWTPITTITGTLPSARTQHAAVYDPNFARMLVFGGDTTLADPGGYSRTLWELPARDPDEGISWVPVAADNMPDARFGHSLAYDTRFENVHTTEVFEPRLGPLGDWQEYTNAPRHLPTYPFMFQLRNGDVFFAGNGPEHAGKEDSWVYSLGGQWTDKKNSTDLGGSAVIFAHPSDPDVVVKFGGDDDVTFAGILEDSTMKASITGGVATWTKQDETGESRVYHNLTALPTGEILMTGGRSHIGGDPVQTARMKKPGDFDWGDALASDPMTRGYHSSALLLPDARVICAGGPGGDNDGDWLASIYSPPYLFDAQGNSATRPQITSSPATMHYGGAYPISVSSAAQIDKVCLIRPGAPTHAFDQNQRYVHVNFTAGPPLTITAPPNGNVAPPGDYLLFVVDNGGVPSVGRWIRVSDVTAPATVSDMEVAATSSSSAILTWTAPGDDGAGGQASHYDLRFSDAPITESSYSYATPVQTAAPLPGGSGEIRVIAGLNACTWYHFAVKTRDELWNWSGLSNAPSGETACDGGGGLTASKIEGAETSPPGAVAAVAGIERQTQVAWLGGAAKLDDLHVVQVVNAGAAPLALDSIAVVRTSDTPNRIALAAGVNLGWGDVQPVASVVGSRDANVLAEIASQSGYTAARGESWVVPRPTSNTALHLLIGTRAADPSNPPSQCGIEFQELAKVGTWTPVGRCHPAPDADRTLWSDVSTDSLRLVFHGGYVVDELSWVVPGSGVPAIEPLALQATLHSRLGEQPPGSRVTGTEASILLPGDAIRLEYSDAGAAATPGGDLFLVFSTSTGSAAAARSTPTSQQRFPSAFALWPSAPNPASDLTMIRFDLPTPMDVRLSVYDTQGRRVGVLAKGAHGAGSHSVTWNIRAPGQRRIPPGIYLCHLEAGRQQARRKLVVLP